MSAFRKAFEKRFSAPAWALFYEVGDATGLKQSRWADALAMSLYPSRGLDLCGFEFKMSRGDWLNELENPDKAETIAKYCDFWYAVDTSGSGVIKESEVPSNWGLLAWDGKKLRDKKRPVKLTPKPMDRGFLAAIMRRANEMVSKEAKRLENDAFKGGVLTSRFEEGVKVGRELATKEIEHENQKLKTKARVYEQFEQASGLQLRDWTLDRVLGQLEAFRSLSYQNGMKGMVSTVADELRKKADDCDALKVAIDKLEAAGINDVMTRENERTKCRNLVCEGCRDNLPFAEDGKRHEMVGQLAYVECKALALK